MRELESGAGNDPAEQDFRYAEELTRQRQWKRRRPRQIQELVNAIVSRRGIAAEKSNRELQEAWERTVGPELASQTRVGSLKRGVLEILVGNSGAMQILNFSRESLLEMFNRETVGKPVRGLKFRSGTIT